MSPPAYFSSRFDNDYNDTWNELGYETDISLSEIKQKAMGVNTYYETGIRLDKAEHYKTAKQRVTSGGLQCHPDSKPSSNASKLPHYRILFILQSSFGLTDNIMEDNRFLNEEVAKRKVARGRKRVKRVTFANAEISEQHLPNCRKHSYNKSHEFGYLHDSSCKNRRFEKALSNQEFLIRGNYIRDNVKPASSYDEFLYKQPKYENEKPERVIPELDRSLSVENDSGISEDIPESDKKNAAVNSLTLHEKNNPRMKSSESAKSGMLPFQPVYSNTPIECDSFTEPATPVKIQVEPVTPVSVPEEPVIPATDTISDPIMLTTDIQSGKNRCTSGDSGFAEDMIGNLSEDSESESETESDEVTKVESPSSSDSGTSSWSDEGEDFDSLVKKSSLISKPKPRHKSWVKKPAVEIKSELLKSESEEVKTDLFTQSPYISPFSKKSPDPVSLKAPSVVGRLLEHHGVAPLTRHPARHPDTFNFDTPSPDDVIREKQAGLRGGVRDVLTS